MRPTYVLRWIGLLLILSGACDDSTPAGAGNDATSAPEDGAGDALVTGDEGTMGDSQAVDLSSHGHDPPADDPDFTFDGGLETPSWSLADPDPGEWPMFKRDLAHTGLADELSGDLTELTSCLLWERRVSPDGTRANNGVVTGIVSGESTVFAVVQGNCDERGVCSGEPPGTVYALQGSSGSVLWQSRLPGMSVSDPYGALLADVDVDGRRELIVPNARRRGGEENWEANAVYAFRTEDEPGGGRGTIQWTFRYEGADEISEGAPTAVDLFTEDSDLEIIIGTDNPAGAARVYVIDGGSGQQRGRAFETGRRHVRDDGCSDLNKVDSGSAAIAEVGGGIRIFVGGWDGVIYSLEWRDDPEPGLYEAVAPSQLPLDDELECGVPKVRSSPAVGQIIPGGELEVAFGYMPEAGEAELTRGFPFARLRIAGAEGLETRADVDVHDWKSSPSLADLDPLRPGLEVAGGRFEGVYSLSQTDSGSFEVDWAIETGGGPVGNRSSPAIADIDDDGELELVVGVEGGNDAGLVVLDGGSGEVEWRWLAPDSERPRGVAASPALGDIDADGRLEVVFLALDGVVRAIDSECP